MEKVLSVVLPAYNEEAMLGKAAKVLRTLLEQEKIEYELMFVDDGSKDKTWDCIVQASKEDRHVHGVHFSRNFGKEAGMYAGLSNALGDYVAIMDVDLQDPPEMIKKMYKIIKEEHYDCAALYTNSHEGYNFIRKGLTNIWYKLIDKISDSKQVSGARDFRLMTRQMVDAIVSMKEYNRYTKGMFGFVGFETKWIEYSAPERAAGTSKFNLFKLIKYALEGIVAFSTSPLILAAYIGLFFCLVAFIAIIVIITKTLIWGDPVGGWPSLSCLIVFVGGIQLFFFGIMGLYLSKIYLEVKKRPVYITKETEENNK